jgi:hypothetical protein
MTDTSLDPKIEGRYVLCGNWRGWDRLDTDDQIRLLRASARIAVRFERIGGEWLSSFRVGDEPETFPDRHLCLLDAERGVLRKLRATLGERLTEAQHRSHVVDNILLFMPGC